MSCPFHEGGGLCAKTTCAILLHKELLLAWMELQVYIAVRVPKKATKNIAKGTTDPGVYCFDQ